MFLLSRGIEHQTSVPHIPQQNGQAEHFNCTILEKAEAMCQTACLPPSFWQDAVEIALHIYNHQPMHHLDWSPPISKWNGETPDVSYCYGPTHWDYISMDLVNFSLFFILSDNFRLQTVRRLPTGTHLSHTLHHSTNSVCIMVNLVSLNLTLFLTVHFCAVHGYAATHMHISHVHASLPFCHCHVVASCY